MVQCKRAEAPSSLSMINVIQYSNCVRNNHLLPMSVILINDQNGSRTIVHHRGAMPEITFEDFKKLDLNDYRMVGSPNFGPLLSLFWKLHSQLNMNYT